MKRVALLLALAACPSFHPAPLPGAPAGETFVDVDGVLHRIPHDQIAKAHLEYDFEADLRRKV